MDADLGDRLVDRILPMARRTQRPGVVAGVGGFASLFSLKDAMAAAAGEGSGFGGGPLVDPLLVAGTDGVGTKLKVAFAANKHDTVGIDLVAMCVNDVLTSGAMPLFFLDYFATGRLELGVAEAVIAGVAEGCRRARAALVGGETAEMPGMYADGEYDLAGFAVGAVERARALDPRRVQPGDALIGVLSRGLHSNGYSLARKALFERAGYTVDSRLPELGRPLGEELLEPTPLYTALVADLLRAVPVHALAHITGGGIPGNLPRVLPAGHVARVERGRWKAPPIFSLIQRAGDVLPADMEATFNMGVGLVVVVPAAAATQALAACQAHFEAALIGEVALLADPAAEAIVELA